MNGLKSQPRIPRKTKVAVSESHMNGAVDQVPPQPVKTKTGNAVMWQAGGQTLSLVMRLGSTLILTRFLDPQAWGIVGTAAAVVTLLEWLSDFGVIPTLVRHKEGNQPGWLWEAWRLNMVRAAGLGTVCGLLAWPYAIWLDVPGLAPILLVLGLRPLVGALKPPGYPLLRRELCFKALVFEELSQTFFGILIGLLVAMATDSPWSMVAGTLGGALAGCIMTHILSPKVGPFIRDPEAARQFRIGAGAIFLNTTVMALWLSADKILAPRLLPMADLGLLALATGWILAGESLGARLLDIHFSRLAKLRNCSHTEDPLEQTQILHAQFFRKTAFLLAIPASVGAIFIPVMLSLVLSGKYIPAGPIMAVLVGRLAFRLASQAEFHLLHTLGYIRPTTISFGLAALITALLIYPVCEWGGVRGLTWLLVGVSGVQALIQTISLRMVAPGAFPGWSAWLAVAAPALVVLCFGF